MTGSMGVILIGFGVLLLVLTLQSRVAASLAAITATTPSGAVPVG